MTPTLKQALARAYRKLEAKVKDPVTMQLITEIIILENRIQQITYEKQSKKDSTNTNTIPRKKNTDRFAS